MHWLHIVNGFAALSGTLPPFHEWLGLVCVSAGALIVLGALLLNPLLLAMTALRRPAPTPPAAGPPPSSVSLITVGRGATQAARKLNNMLSLRVPVERREIIVASDGPDDAMRRIVEADGDATTIFTQTAARRGKNAALNRAVALAGGDVLVFTDLDAHLPEDALVHLLAPFDDPAVGAVCGQRLIGEDAGALRRAQADYIRLDSMLKRVESRCGSLTSNDGKLHALRRPLFRPVPDGVTDDLFLGLCAVRQHRRLVFAPQALALVRTPSRSPAHELARRRRIVCRSLRGLFCQRALFNPLRYGTYGLRLFANKILRRLIPLAYLLTAAGSLVLAAAHPVAAILAALHLLTPLAAAAILAYRARRSRKPPGRLAQALAYGVVGNAGMLLGVFDFLAGRRYVVWEPLKSDTPAASA